MPKAAPWLATSCNLTIPPGTAIWCPSRSADSAQALVAASVTSANSPTPAQQSADQAAQARRPLAAAVGVDCSRRQTDVMSLNPTPDPRRHERAAKEVANQSADGCLALQIARGFSVLDALDFPPR